MNSFPKRFRYDEWSDSFRQLFIQYFDRFLEDKSFVRRIARVATSFYNGGGISPEALGQFSAMLMGNAALFTAFRDYEQMLDKAANHG